MIPASKRAKTVNDLDGAATVTGIFLLYLAIYSYRIIELLGVFILLYSPSNAWILL
jgi:hypothetical protein